jgi:hypothetical protein
VARPLAAFAIVTLASASRAPDSSATMPPMAAPVDCALAWAAKATRTSGQDRLHG